MIIYYVLDNVNDVVGLYSTFEKAKEKAREVCIEPWLECSKEYYSEEALNNILNSFEEEGYIEEVCYIECKTLDN